MAKEIERTFLVVNDSFKEMATKVIKIKQGYLSRDPDRTVRIRIADDKGFLTVKGRNNGCERQEFEYEIPLHDAEQMMYLCTGRVIDKTRYIVPFEGFIWEVDEYHKDLAGLVVTEVELEKTDEVFDMAPFAGREVTGNPAYYNSQL